MFIIGLSSFVSIRVWGVLYISEVISLVMMPFIFRKVSHTEFRLNKLFFLLTLWLIGTLFAGYYNNIGSNNLIKGIGTVLLFFPSFILAFWALKNNYEYIFYYLAGKAISIFIGFFLVPMDFVKDLILEKGLASLLETLLVYMLAPLLIFFVSLLYYKGKYHSSIILTLLFSFWSLFNGSRSTFLIFGFVAVILFFLGKITKQNKHLKHQKMKKKFIPMLFIFLLSIIGFYSFYEYTASKGILGEYSQNKFNNQKNSSKLGLLMGRADFFQCLLGISENPIIGYGPYAKDKSNIRLRTAIKYEDSGGYNTYYNLNEEESMVPRHSYILGAWIFSGILAVPFWLFILYLIFTFLRKHLWYNHKLIAFFLLTCISLLWNIFFSPLQQRTDLCISVAMIVLVTQKNLFKYKKKYDENLFCNIR